MIERRGSDIAQDRHRAAGVARRGRRLCVVAKRKRRRRQCAAGGSAGDVRDASRPAGTACARQPAAAAAAGHLSDRARAARTRRCRNFSTPPTHIRTAARGSPHASTRPASSRARQAGGGGAALQGSRRQGRQHDLRHERRGLGMAEAQVAQGKFDNAIAIYTELSRDTNSTLPLDSVLMHLGRAYARAGKKEEAVRSFTRVVDEFPQSAYAADARRETRGNEEAVVGRARRPTRSSFPTPASSPARSLPSASARGSTRRRSAYSVGRAGPLAALADAEHRREHGRLAKRSGKSVR